MDTKGLSQFRKAVYKFLEGVGFELTERQQGDLSTLLKSVHEYASKVPPNAKPIKHEIICPKCQGIKLKAGIAFRHYKKKIRKVGGVAE